MRNKPAQHTQVAAAISASGPSGALASVVVALELKLDKDTAMASYACTGCNTRFGAMAGTKPFCVTCGSQAVNVLGTEDPKPEVLEESSELSAATCASCGVHNIMRDAVAAALKGHAHCVQCGTDIPLLSPDNLSGEADNTDVFADADAGGLPADPLDDMTDVGDPAQPQADLVDPLSAATDDADSTDDGDTTAAADAAKDGEMTAAKASTDPANPNPAAADPGANNVAESPDDGKGGDVEQNNNGVEGQDDQLGQGMHTDDDNLLAGVDDEFVDVDLAEVMPEGEDDSFDLLASDDDNITAMVNGVAIARVSREQSGHKRFGEIAWLRAVKLAAANEGRSKALSTYKFTPITIKAPLAKLVKAGVDKALAKEKASVVASQKELSADYQQALGIALAGINKNFWRNTENALKAGFFAELESAGVASPVKLIDKVFASSGRAFLQTVMAKAEELMALKPEVRNELATQVDSANYIAVAESDEDESDDDSEEASVENMGVTARLAGHGTRTKAVTASRTQASEIGSITGGRKLFTR